jgi:hypothetical protein
MMTGWWRLSATLVQRLLLFIFKGSVGRDRCSMAILIGDSPIFERIGEAGSITSSTRMT